jgi:TPP-dependent 2-oxoacid decarboxylase
MLELLQQLHDTGTLKWIGTCSELNASYAADGYARLNDLGALASAQLLRLADRAGPRLTIH